MIGGVDIRPPRDVRQHRLERGQVRMNVGDERVAHGWTGYPVTGGALVADMRHMTAADAQQTL